MRAIIWVFLFILLIDGIKLLIESFAPYKEKKFSSNHSEVSVIIPLYNKEKIIGETLRSVIQLFPEKNVFVVNDGSTDNSLETAREIAPNINFISTVNQGKVRAIETALDKIKTPFVLLLDADVILPKNFSCPTSFLIKGPITAVAFNVMPKTNSEKKLILEFQSHEYAKSMQIGRKFQDRTASVHCISGAIGLFKTDRLKLLSSKHTKIFPGEDLERTLIELASDGKVIFVDRIVKTETPRTIWQLTKQRVIGWWPGLWRNIPLFLKVGTKKKTPWRLRWEIAYELFSLLTDPFKLISLVTIILVCNWNVLILLYLIYFFLEWIVYLRMRNGYTKRPIAVIGLYFFYNLFQIFLRVGGLLVYCWNRMIKRKWKGVAVSFLVLILILLPRYTTAKDKSNGIFSIAYQKVMDSSGRKIDNCNLYLGYKGFFLNVNTAKQAPRYLIVGKYLKFDDLVIVPEVRIKEHDKLLKLTAMKPLFGPIVSRISVSYSFINGKKVKDFPILSVGSDYYWGDYNYSSVDVIKEFGRKHAVTMVLKNHLQFKNGLFLNLGIAANNLWHKGYFLIVGFRQVYVGYSSFQNFDYCQFDRKYLTVGLKLKF